MRLRACAELPLPASLTDITHEATTRAFSKPAVPAPAEMFDQLCRIAGVPTIADGLAGWQEDILRQLLATDRGPVIALSVAPHPDPRLLMLEQVVGCGGIA